MLVSARPAAFHVTFSAPQAELRTDSNQARLLLPSPLLAGPDTEMIGAPAAEVHWEGDILVARQPQTLIGALLVDASGRLEEVVEQAYLRILEITRGWHLYRVWNYLPGINDMRRLEMMDAAGSAKRRPRLVRVHRPPGGTDPSARLGGDRCGGARSAGGCPLVPGAPLWGRGKLTRSGCRCGTRT